MHVLFYEICNAMHLYQKTTVPSRQFAIAITMPGVGGAEIVNATLKHNVHILDKELYRKGKDYSVFLGSTADDTAIDLLFIFKDGSSISVSSYGKLLEVIAELESVTDPTLS
jgi:hypothetical protein